jgi:hypothetical protein
LIDVLETTARGMLSGVFPQVPGDETVRPGKFSWENCVYCDFDLPRRPRCRVGAQAGHVWLSHPLFAGIGGEPMTAPIVADQLCPAGRDAVWARKRATPGYRIHAALTIEASG